MKKTPISNHVLWLTPVHVAALLQLRRPLSPNAALQGPSAAAAGAASSFEEHVEKPHCEQAARQRLPATRHIAPAALQATRQRKDVPHSSTSLSALKTSSRAEEG